MTGCSGPCRARGEDDGSRVRLRRRTGSRLADRPSRVACPSWAKWRRSLAAVLDIMVSMDRGRVTGYDTPASPLPRRQTSNNQSFFLILHFPQADLSSLWALADALPDGRRDELPGDVSRVSDPGWRGCVEGMKADRGSCPGSGRDAKTR